jgi:hypothetical protein
MSTQILAVLVVFVAFSQIGCSDDKPKIPMSVQAAVHACQWDSTGECQKRAKMYAEHPELIPQINATQANALKNGGTGTVQVVNGPDGKPTVAPVLPQSIQEKAKQVQAAIEADNNNPRSLHYDPPQPSQVVDRTPSSVASTGGNSSPAIAPASVSGGGGGEVVR